jgi:cysteine desulfurase
LTDFPIYLDTQASGRIAPEVRDAIYSYWMEENGNPHSSHEQGLRAKTAISGAINTISECVGCLPRELTLVSGATAANNLAIKGIEYLIDEGRPQILVSAIEHPCVLETARFMASQRGFQLIVVPVDGCGFVDLRILEQQLNEQVALVSIMLGNNEIGTIQDIPEISRLAHKVGALVHTDATQACGRISIDVLDLDCDMLSLSAHKISGPIGIGGLFVRDGTTLLPLIHGGNQQALASGTMSPELAVGFASACRKALADLDTADFERQRDLISRFEHGLNDAGYKFEKNGPVEEDFRLPGTTHLTFQNITLPDLQAWISPYVSFSSKSACASENSDTSHVLSAIGLNEKDATNSARFSVCSRTTDEEIDGAILYFREYLTSIQSRGAAE